VDAPSVQTIEVHHAAGIAVVALAGEHDISTVPALQAIFDEIPESTSRVVVDLTSTTFVDSSVIGVLMNFSRRREGRVSAVTAPGTPPARVFEVLSLPSVFPTHSSVADAVAGLKLVE
jgi:anti-anti-sigma factor